MTKLLKNTSLQIMSLLFILYVNGQEKQVKWNYIVNKISATVYEIQFTATMEEGWHIYSQFTPAGGPFATRITFRKNPLLIINSKPKEEGELQIKYEDAFGVDVKFFTNKVTFFQLIRIKSKIKTVVTSTIQYMICTDKQCLPPATSTFNIALN